MVEPLDVIIAGVSLQGFSLNNRKRLKKMKKI